MTLLHEAFDFKKFDTRVIDRNQDRGMLGQKDIEKMLKDLPDDGNNAEFVSIEDLAAQEDSGSRS